MEDSSGVLPVRHYRVGHCLPGETTFSDCRHPLTFDARAMSDGATLPVNGRLVEEAIMLTMSHAAGANEPAVRDITLGGLLQWAAETTPDRIALIAGVPDPDHRRQWTYGDYLNSQHVSVALTEGGDAWRI